MKKVGNFLLIVIDRVKAPTPKFWKKTRNWMMAIGGASSIIILAGPVLLVIIVHIAGYGLTAGAVGTALSQMGKIKEDE